MSIAVLPFLNMSNDAEQEFFADGITEDLITEISRIGDSLVIARNTVFTYKGRSVDIARIGKELGVRYVLEGSVRRLGSRVRITAQLIETSTGSHLWAEKYDRDLVDLFEVQDEVVRAVAASTHTRLMINEGDIAERATEEELDFWTLAARGRRELYRGTRKSLLSAEEIGRRLVALDPQSAKAHQINASAMLKLVTMGFRQATPETTARIAAAAREAARLAPQDEYSLFIYGLVLSTLLGRPEEAILQFKQALRINPNFSGAYATIGSAYTMLGKPDDAIAEDRDVDQARSARSHHLPPLYSACRCQFRETGLPPDAALGAPGDRSAARLLVSECAGDCGPGARWRSRARYQARRKTEAFAAPTRRSPVSAPSCIFRTDSGNACRKASRWQVFHKSEFAIVFVGQSTTARSRLASTLTIKGRYACGRFAAITSGASASTRPTSSS